MFLNALSIGLEIAALLGRAMLVSGAVRTVNVNGSIKTAARSQATPEPRAGLSPWFRGAWFYGWYVHM